MYCYVLENSTDIYTGLALEQFFFNSYIAQQHSSSQHKSVPSNKSILGECIVLFWQSQTCVVIGRNQNPLYECNLSYMKKHNVLLARRDSGGGAVYHDAQNINICIISAAHEQQIEKNLLCFKTLLASLGVDATITKRNDLMIQNKKISGSAMRYSKQTLMHHFTLLLSPNATNITTALQAKHKQSIASFSTSSFHSDITGTYLSYKQITEAFVHNSDQLASILYIHNEFGINTPAPTHITYIKDIHSFTEQYAQNIQNKSTIPLLDTERKRLASTEWIYKKSPPFTITVRFEQEELAPFDIHSDSTVFRITCKHGCIQSIQDDTHKILYTSDTTDPIIVSYTSLLQASKVSKYAIIRVVVKKLLSLFF